MSPARRSTMPMVLRGRVPAGTVYVGEDASYYYFMHPDATNQLGELFDNIGNMFSRMVKFTPKSFTPGNIYKGFVNTTLTVASGGLYQVLPKSLKKTVYEVGKVAIPVVAGGVLAVMAGPAVMGILGPKLSAAGSLLGKAANTVGGPLLSLLGKLPQNKQAEVAQTLTPEQIAYMDRTGQIPADLQGYLDGMAQSTFNPSMSGAASLYGQPVKPVEAGFFGGMDTNMLLLIGVPAVFFVVTQWGGAKK